MCLAAGHSCTLSIVNEFKAIEETIINLAHGNLPAALEAEKASIILSEHPMCGLENSLKE